MPFTRHHLQVALGLLWLLDGVLQAQPFMFTRDFATQVIAPAAQGQPGFVSDPVHWASTVIAAHPGPWNALFAAVQLLLGVGLLIPRTVRPALAASIVWGLGVWYFGEALGGLAGGDATLATGAPGAALLLAVLAAAAWPHGDRPREGPASWLPLAWALVWIGAAPLQALPQNGGTALVVAEYLIGVGALARTTRAPAAALGLALALGIWIVSQDAGRLFSGQATDPNSEAVLALMAIALLRPRIPQASELRRAWPRRRAPAPLHAESRGRA